MFKIKNKQKNKNKTNTKKNSLINLKSLKNT